MGSNSFIERYTIKKQLILTFLMILGSSLVMTVITILAGVSWLISNDGMQPANYYERQIPAIIRYVQQQQGALLLPQARTGLEQIIPLSGIRYQVLNADGEVQYGTVSEQLIKGKQELLRSLNTTELLDSTVGFGGSYARMIPVATAEGDLKGALVLLYKLQMSADSPSAHLLQLVGAGVLVCSPFIYIALFTTLFASRLGRRILRPVQELIQASERIRRQDLDVPITYNANNEIGRLSQAFEAMRRELKDSLLREWRLEQERRDLMDAIAHDFRTPMTIIQGNVELLEEAGALPEEKRMSHLNIIEHNVKRVNRLIQDILAVSEKELDYFPLMLAEVDVKTFLEMKEREIQYLGKPRQIVCTVTLEERRRHPGSPALLDVQRIAQVLDNIVANSLRFLPDGGELALRAILEEERLTLQIRDSGPGFAVEDIPFLFDKFYKGVQGQTGLGLYTARMIVRKHGGTIQAENLPDGGACVTFTVSIGQDEDSGCGP
ncbi:sensor histidine kinase [Paenibacillus albidus]|uniref:histidine kinase n=1 Tax=Paenibacillus albidus TaxID=2041023 RepID=A0A917FM69_9BACL|nr:HAMP domain-containing sensor histidine kinase [Paenibacillus albidus]GGF89263.1 sensor histidine kinase [Paenibacillus albidus]